jgi:hypothetical protein
MTDFIEIWKRAGETGDAALARTALAEEAVLVSPLTSQFQFVGRDVIGELLEDVFGVAGNFHYEDEFRAADSVALFATARIGSVALGEAQRLRLDKQGMIAEITLFMRPIPAMTALLRGLGPRVARRQGRPGVARILSVAGAALDGVASSGDVRFVPLAGPLNRSNN